MFKHVFILIFLIVNNCKAQKMTEIVIHLDTPIEEKSLFEQSEFQQSFEKPLEDNSLVLKASNTNYTGNLNVFYPSGEKYASYNYADGKQEGGQTTYFKNGNLHTSLSIINGNYNGKYIIYYEDGKPKMISEFDLGQKKESKNYYENGQLIDEAIYKNEGKVVEGIVYYKNGFVKSSYSFNESKKEGFFKNYFENENKILESEGKMIKKNLFTSHKDGLWKYYHKNGNIKEEGQWGVGGRHGKQNIKMGLWKIYDEAGGFIEEHEYNNLGNRIK